MKTSSFILIPATSSGADIIGTPQKAAAYYSKDKSVQTLSWFVALTFRGIITIEATLDTASDTDNYFPILTIGNGTDPISPENDFENITGNYTWIRATVTNFTAGSIGKVVIGY